MKIASTLHTIKALHNTGYTILVVRRLVRFVVPFLVLNGRTGNRFEDPPTFHTRSR